MGVVLGVDGGNSKTELIAATTDGELLAYVGGPGSNSHGAGGPEGTADVVGALVVEAGVETPAELGVFFLCGADVPADVVLGGGMLAAPDGVLYAEVVSRLPAGTRPLVLDDPPVLGAALAALDVAGATDAAKARLRKELRAR